MKRVAVTGASGFVGGHLVGELARHGHRVVAVVRGTSDVSRLTAAEVRRAELNDVESLTRALTGCDAVIHLAGAVDFAGDWPRFEAINVVGTANTVAAARAAGVGRFVHGSSIVAVGASARPVLLDESTKWNLRGMAVPYVTTKRRAEEVALEAAGIDVVVANLASVIGPDDFAGSEFGVMCRRFWQGRLPIHFGGGLNYVDVRDAATGLRLAMDRGRPGCRYILGGANRSTGAFFGELARVAGRPIPRFRLPGAAAHVVAWAEATFGSGRRKRAYLSPGQAR
ncbi:MAG: NAD-dependent epimerase/dehydratase family protein, partial [Gemmataceae bacterium]|nr:NAD-dependent epimerase/dehydratase family protein [Gemmataceae bacterium]